MYGRLLRKGLKRDVLRDIYLRLPRDLGAYNNCEFDSNNLICRAIRLVRRVNSLQSPRPGTFSQSLNSLTPFGAASNNGGQTFDITAMGKRHSQPVPLCRIVYESPSTRGFPSYCLSQVPLVEQHNESQSSQA